MGVVASVAISATPVSVPALGHALVSCVGSVTGKGTEVVTVVGGADGVGARGAAWVAGRATGVARGATGGGAATLAVTTRAV